MTRAELAALVDHTLLRPEADAAAIDALCAEAAELGCATACVNGAWVPRAAAALAGTGVGVCAVVGFPLGAMHRELKAAEAENALAHGASEIDTVLPVGPLRADDLRTVERDVEEVRRACAGATLKVIVESAALDEEHLEAACRVAVAAGADFVKTSTGFHPAGGATAEAVRMMREVVGPHVGVKASGGIRDAAAALAMVEAGASRLGLSGTRAVLDGL